MPRHHTRKWGVLRFCKSRAIIPSAALFLAAIRPDSVSSFSPFLNVARNGAAKILMVAQADMTAQRGTTGGWACGDSAVHLVDPEALEGDKGRQTPRESNKAAATQAASHRPSLLSPGTKYRSTPQRCQSSTSWFPHPISEPRRKNSRVCPVQTRGRQVRRSQPTTQPVLPLSALFRSAPAATEEWLLVSGWAWRGQCWGGFGVASRDWRLASRAGEVA